MSYQDKWLKGKLLQKGYRECEDRYEIIRTLCNGFNRQFTVCDIGANWCYFGIRLTEDFPECTVIAFEYNSPQRRQELLRMNRSDRVTLIPKKVSISDLRQFSKCFKFDLILGLSVIHHLIGPLQDRIDSLRGIGCSVIIELALSDSRRVKNQSEILEIIERIPGCAILGYGLSHLDPETKRPIILVPGFKV
jgi:hypothetical protein